MNTKVLGAPSLEKGINYVFQNEENNILNVIDGSENIHEKIHEVRKSLKKLRAAIRLVRKCTDRYKEENIFYRDLGRIVSTLRDKTALIESLTRLRENYGAYLYKKTFRKFDKILHEERESRFKTEFEKTDPLQIISHQINRHKEEFAWLKINTFDQILPGLGKVYKRGKKAMALVEEESTTENFHDWRKRVKYLKYQLDMMLTSWPHTLSSWEENLNQLSDMLGDDHDLALLDEKAEAVKDLGFNSPEEKSLLHALIDQERKQLQSGSLDLGKKIYADSEDSFISRMEAIWDYGPSSKTNE